MSGDQWEHVADMSELADSDRLSVIIDDTPALLIRNGESFYAIEDACTHDGQPLTDGTISDNEIECPRHGARFDIRSGEALCMPATEPIKIFEVSVREAEIYARPHQAHAASADSTLAAPASSTAATSETSETSAENSSSPAAEQTAASDDAGPSNPFLEVPGEGAMLDALKQVIDPELFVNIVDLGLVYDITTQNENDVLVTMTLTSPACPAGPQLVSQARSALEKMPGVNSAEIRLTMSPPWTPDMMTEDARDQLGIF